MSSRDYDESLILQALQKKKSRFRSSVRTMLETMECDGPSLLHNVITSLNLWEELGFTTSQAISICFGASSHILMFSEFLEYDDVMTFPTCSIAVDFDYELSLLFEMHNIPLSTIQSTPRKRIWKRYFELLDPSKKRNYKILRDAIVSFAALLCAYNCTMLHSICRTNMTRTENTLSDRKIAMIRSFSESLREYIVVEDEDREYITIYDSN